MLRTTLASSRALRVCALGLITFTTAILISSESAEARRYKHRRHHHHVVRKATARSSPPSSSTAIQARCSASNNPDGIRRPASLTKIMTLYLLFERLDAGKMKLDTEMDVSEFASEQAPTKLGLEARPDAQGRGCHQGPGDALRQRRRRRDRGSRCRR